MVIRMVRHQPLPIKKTLRPDAVPVPNVCQMVFPAVRFVALAQVCGKNVAWGLELGGIESGRNATAFDPQLALLGLSVGPERKVRGTCPAGNCSKRVGPCPGICDGSANLVDGRAILCA